MRTPDFFIVGAPKCGTTAFYEYLRPHPDIFLPEAKEIPYFGSDLVLKPRATPEAFQGHFVGARDEKRVGTAWVQYLSSKKAAIEIREYCSDARIIIMLRNPVDMIHSQHSHMVWSAREDITDFAEALDAEPERRAGRSLPRTYRTGEYPIEVLLYRELGRYAEAVGRYLDVFGPDRVHVILFDEFSSDTAGCYRAALEFLDVDCDFAAAFPVFNSNKRARNLALQRLISYPPRPVRFAARVLLTSRGRARVRAWNTSVEGRAAMDAGLRAELQAEFAPDVVRLGEMLGRDLSGWLGA